MQKPVLWLGDSLSRVRAFAPEARHEAGVQLGLVQAGLQAVYVLHAFHKKSRKTARLDIDLARRRFAALVQDRRQQWPKS